MSLTNNYHFTGCRAIGCANTHRPPAYWPAANTAAEPFGCPRNPGYYMISRLIQILQALKTPQCRVIPIVPEARIPSKGSAEAAGCDLSSAENMTIPAHGRGLVHTGIRIAPPRGCHIEVRPRSGLALKRGLTVLNTPGTIDADYRGEVGVILINLSGEPQTIEPGERICQMVIAKHESPEVIEVQELSETERGEGGFGHSGRK